MRYFQCFQTKEGRTAWEKEMKQKNDRFKVCFHTPVKQLAKEVYISRMVRHYFKYATVYTFREVENDG